MIWIYIAENGITYSCIPLFAMHPSLVHHHLYIDSLCPIFGTQIDSISLNPFGYRNSILLMYYYVKARPMPLEFFTCCVGWCCEVLKWLLMMLTHKCQNSRTMPLTKAFFLILYNQTMSAIWHWAKLFICSESIFLIPFTSSLHSLKRERKQCPLPNLSNKSLVWLH